MSVGKSKFGMKISRSEKRARLQKLHRSMKRVTDTIVYCPIRLSKDFFPIVHDFVRRADKDNQFMICVTCPDPDGNIDITFFGGPTTVGPMVNEIENLGDVNFLDLTGREIAHMFETLRDYLGLKRDEEDLREFVESIYNSTLPDFLTKEKMHIVPCRSKSREK